MSRQLTATKTSHEKWGGEGTGGGKGTGDRRRKGGKRERNSKSQAFLICYCLHPVQETNPTTFLDSHKRSPRLKAKFYTREKFVLGIKKQHYFRWNWKPFQVAYIIGHEWDGMTHVHVCRLCQSCQCLVCLAFCRNSPQERQSESAQMSSKTILIGLSIFRSGGEKSLHWRPSWEHAPYHCSSQNTEDFTARS